MARLFRYLLGPVRRRKERRMRQTQLEAYIDYEIHEARLAAKR